MSDALAGHRFDFWGLCSCGKRYSDLMASYEDWKEGAREIAHYDGSQGLNSGELKSLQEERDRLMRATSDVSSSRGR